MGFFSRKKNKAKDSEKKEGKKAASEEQPKQAYKHVPKHAAADSYSQGGRGETHQDRAQIALASRRRESNAMYDGALGDATIAQDIAHQVAHGTSSPRHSPSLRTMHRNYSEETFLTSRDGRPGPSTPRRSYASSTSRLNPNSRRNTNDYFSQGQPNFPIEETSKYLGKRPVPTGYDSGYESAEPSSGAHSRAPSESNLLSTSAASDSSASSSGSYMLPELKFNEETAFSRKSMDVSPDDIVSTGLVKSNSKKTRFQDQQHDPMPRLSLIEQYRKADEGSADSIPLQQGNNARSAESTSYRQDSQELLDAFEAAQIMDSAQEELPVDSPNVVSRSHAPTVREPQQQVRPVSAHRSSSSSAPVRQSVSARASSVPPLSILNGHKVNKRGKVLDEEGDPIGELVKGDLLDCVRQKVNVHGEVIDDYGRVVGMVRTIPVDVSEDSTPSSAPYVHSEQAPRFSPPQNEESEAPRGRRSWQLYSPERAMSLQDVSMPEREPTQELRPKSSRTIAARNSQSFDLQRVSPERDVVMSRPARNASERSLSDLSKSYARPAMSSVPENNVPEEDMVVNSSGAFSYKGEIPTFDGPGANSMLRPTSPPTIPYRPALAGGHPNSSLFPPMRPGIINSRRSTFAGGMPMPVHPSNRSYSLRKSVSGFGE